MNKLPTILAGTTLALAVTGAAMAENHEATDTTTGGAAAAEGATTEGAAAGTEGTTEGAATGGAATGTEGTTAEGAAAGTEGMAEAGSAAEMGQMLAEPNTEAMAAATASEGYMQVMTSAMERMNSRPMTGDAEIDYITMMIPHHQSAVDNSRIVLANTDDPEIQEFAQRVIDEQEAEIAELQAMLEARMGQQ